MLQRSGPVILALLLAVVGCAQKDPFQPFKDASGEFESDVPADWRREGDDDLGRRPAATLTWVGMVAEESEGMQLGAMIHVSRFQRTGVPPGFKKSTLDPTDLMFGPGPFPPGAPPNITTLTVSGHPARRYHREFEVVLGGGLHKTNGPIAMRLEDIVIQTPKAYYVLEYRATKSLFDKHYRAFERLTSTFWLIEQRVTNRGN